MSDSPAGESKPSLPALPKTLQDASYYDTIAHRGMEKQDHPKLQGSGGFVQFALSTQAERMEAEGSTRLDKALGIQAIADLGPVSLQGVNA